jgi:hypothetical protein
LAYEWTTIANEVHIVCLSVRKEVFPAVVSRRPTAASGARADNENALNQLEQAAHNAAKQQCVGLVLILQTFLFFDV